MTTDHAIEIAGVCAAAFGEAYTGELLAPNQLANVRFISTLAVAVARGHALGRQPAPTLLNVVPIARRTGTGFRAYAIMPDSVARDGERGHLLFPADALEHGVDRSLVERLPSLQGSRHQRAKAWIEQDRRMADFSYVAEPRLVFKADGFDSVR